MPALEPGRAHLLQHERSRPHHPTLCPERRRCLQPLPPARGDHRPCLLALQQPRPHQSLAGCGQSLRDHHRSAGDQRDPAALQPETDPVGVPADKSHDLERECPQGPRAFTAPPTPCPSPSSRSPLSANQTTSFACTTTTPGRTAGNFSGPEIDYTMPGLITDCDKPRFEPDVEIEPTGKQANTPTGLDIHIKIAQNENPNALATPPVKRFTVRLPEGMSLLAVLRRRPVELLAGADESRHQRSRSQCPDASRIGEVTLHTPLLPKAREGIDVPGRPGRQPLRLALRALPRLARHRRTRRPDQDPGQDRSRSGHRPDHHRLRRHAAVPFRRSDPQVPQRPTRAAGQPPSCGKQTIGVEVASYAQPAETGRRLQHL